MDVRINIEWEIMVINVRKAWNRKDFHMFKYNTWYVYFSRFSKDIKSYIYITFYIYCIPGIKQGIYYGNCFMQLGKLRKLTIYNLKSGEPRKLIVKLRPEDPKVKLPFQSQGQGMKTRNKVLFKSQGPKAGELESSALKGRRKGSKNVSISFLALSSILALNGLCDMPHIWWRQIFTCFTESNANFFQETPSQTWKQEIMFYQQFVHQVKWTHELSQ